MTQLPLWAVYAVAFGTPLSALLGVLLTLWLTRRTAHEVDVRAGREELMRNLRWAVGLAADPDADKREAGVQQLRALGESELLDPRDQIFIDAALRAVNQDARAIVVRTMTAGTEPDVVEVDDSTSDTRTGSGVVLTEDEEKRNAR